MTSRAALASALSAPRHPLGAEHHRLDLVGRQHQRRHVVIGVEQVPDARLALDRHALADEVGDVAVDRALGDFEFVRQRGAVTGRLDRRRIWMIWNRRSARRMGGDSCCQDAVSRPGAQAPSSRRGVTRSKSGAPS